MTQIRALKRLSSTPAGVKLGPLGAIADRGARSFVLRIGDGRFHGFIVRRGETAHGYVDRCPHAGLPLAQTLDAYLSPDGEMIACGWHGALFSIDDELCFGGPCAGARLSPWPVAVRDGILFTTAEQTP